MASGVLTGLLGVGGGLVIVPAFLTFLPMFGMGNLTIHNIIGISATCVFINSAVSVFYRRKEQFLPAKEITKYGTAIIIGTVFGAVVSSFAVKNILLCVYILISSLSLYLMLFKSDMKNKNPAFAHAVYPIFSLIGALSASIGIGGAVFFSTAMNYFTEKDTKELLPTTTLLVLIHAFFAFASKWSMGFVTVQIIPIAFAASLVGSKIGILVSQRLSSKTINKLMLVVLVLALVRIVLELVYGS